MSKHFETKAIRTQTERSQHAEHSTPLFLTSSFIFLSHFLLRNKKGKSEGIKEKQRKTLGILKEFLGFSSVFP